jgi:pentatricopeptide repeat protein
MYNGYILYICTGIKANHDTMKAVLAAATQTPNKQAVVHVEDALETMKLPYDVSILNSLMAGYNRAGDLNGVLRTVDRMVIDTFPPIPT